MYVLFSAITLISHITLRSWLSSCLALIRLALKAASVHTGRLAKLSFPREHGPRIASCIWLGIPHKLAYKPHLCGPVRDKCPLREHSKEGLIQQKLSNPDPVNPEPSFTRKIPGKLDFLCAISGNSLFTVIPNTFLALPD